MYGPSSEQKARAHEIKSVHLRVAGLARTHVHAHCLSMCVYPACELNQLCYESCVGQKPFPVQRCEKGGICVLPGTMDGNSTASPNVCGCGLREHHQLWLSSEDSRGEDAEEETEIHPFCGSRMVLTGVWSPGTGELLKALECRGVGTVYHFWQFPVA